MNNKELEKKVKIHCYNVLKAQGYICAVDVLMKLNYLSKEDYENWRFGRVPYLEKVCRVNLNKIKLINNTIRKTALGWGLKESLTAYKKYGKGRKFILRFSKSNNPHVERGYATHYVSKRVLQPNPPQNTSP